MRHKLVPLGQTRDFDGMWLVCDWPLILMIRARKHLGRIAKIVGIER